jgi:hypothetical protein
MSCKIVPYIADHEEAVRQFNARIDAGIIAEKLDRNLYNTRFPTSVTSIWLPQRAGCDLYQECFVAIDASSIVRGGYMLKHQPFLWKGNPAELVTYQIPISEGIVDRKYAILGLNLYRDALRRHPQLWGFGGGGLHVPVGKFLVAVGCRTTMIPFWFRVISPNAFLRNIAYLRTHPLMRIIGEFLDFSGLGWLGIKGLFSMIGHYRSPADVSYEIVPEFSEWTNDVWDRSKNDYSLIAVRDHQILNILYPASQPRFIRLKITKGNLIVGWAVLLNTLMSKHGYFGDMRVGTLVDCLSKPEDTRDVVACATEVLESCGSDLIISNQSNQLWCNALRSCGFLEGPSNLPLYFSPKLAEHWNPLDGHVTSFHFNRGDGDGPFNL